MSKIGTLFKQVLDNGGVSVGLSAGADRSLPAHYKLAISKNFKDESIDTRIKFAISHIDETLAKKTNLNRLIQSAIIGIMNMKLVREKSPDVKVVDVEGKIVLLDNLTPDEINEAISIIVATKVNLFSTNHHTGQGSLTGYAKKAFDIISKPNDMDETEAVTVYHMIGHWADSAKVFSGLGFKDTKGESKVSSKDAGKKGEVKEREKGIGFNRQPDLIPRLRSFPAGTGRLAVAYACIKKFMGHPLFSVVYRKSECEGLVALAHEVLAEPLRYHIGASHFSSKPAPPIELAEYEDFINDLFTLAKNLASKSTLAKSPQIAKHDEEREDLVIFCKNYNEQSSKLGKEFVKGLFDEMAKPESTYTAEARNNLRSLVMKPSKK
jgi:hypothetical protein